MNERLIIFIFLLLIIFLFIVELLILLIKNNIPKANKDGTVTKHYHEIQRSLSIGICDWVYIIPTIKNTISNDYFEIEIDIFFVYLFVSYKIIDIDDES